VRLFSHIVLALRCGSVFLFGYLPRTHEGCDNHCRPYGDSDPFPTLPIYDNVDRVKVFCDTLPPRGFEMRHFALAENLPPRVTRMWLPTKLAFLIRCGETLATGSTNHLFDAGHHD
jgi:hypothetical protein